MDRPPKNQISHFGSPSADPERELSILYATETGNAHDVAERIAREAKRRHFRVRLSSVDEYPIAALVNEPVIVFVVSTTGSGVEPRSLTPMWKTLLRSDLPPDLLEGVDYAVFGLGDTAYEKFCWAAKKLARRLESLGAREICARGEGDEQHPLGLEGGLDPWIERLFQSLLQLFPIPPGLEIIPADRLRPSRICISESQLQSDSTEPSNYPSKFIPFTLNTNKRITALDWYQDVRHMEFETDDRIEYRPGDIAVIHPEASPADVEEILINMGWANVGDEKFRVSLREGEQPLPSNVPPLLSLRDIFTRYVDISAVPRRSFFDLLRHFASDDLEREKLTEFSSTDGQEELYEYCSRTRRTIREVLPEFRSVRVPREYIFDLFPPLRPRQFSIASSVKLYPRQIHLCVAIVQYRTKLRVTRRGVCTSYLASLPEGARIKIGLQRGLLRTPSDSSVPIICVGPGTGIAPMRALIQERSTQGAQDNTLYFGCRSAPKDQHYQKEWANRVRAGNLRYRLSCSRDGPEGKPKVYVQHLLEQDSQLVWDIINNKGGYVFISGSSNKMPAAVKKAIQDAAVNVGGLPESDGAQFISRLEREGRLFEECWS